MSRIDDLIAEHCPDGVPYRGLTDVADYVRGITYNKGNEQADGPVSVLRANNISLATNTLNFSDVKRVSGSVRVRDNQRLVRGDILICAGSGSKDHIGKVAFVFDDLEHTFGGFMGVVRTKGELEPRFLFHLLTGGSFLSYLRSALSTTTINNLNAGVMRGFRIPVPPLEVQRAIVEVLDTFSKLEAELEAELEARRHQYQHYRVVLLNSSDDGGVRDVSLGEIIRLNFGARITKKDNAGTIYPVYGGGGESFRTDAFNREDEWVISRFAMSANCVRRVTGKFWMLDSGFTFDVTDATVDKDFVGQLLLSMQPTIFATSTQSAQKNIDVDGFKRLRVRIPSLDTQRRVASALANFDGLVNDLSVGLPAELAARRQQYEYYRDKLLSFKELEVAT